MPRMRSVIARAGLVLSLLFVGGAWLPARADVIRPKPGRTFPDIAGDIVGTQTYKYDPTTQTGTFALMNAPHLISLGPSDKDLVPMQPEKDGTLIQSLKMKLDSGGRLVESPANRFEIRGTVVIDNETYKGLLLEGKPTAFGVGGRDASRTSKPEVFDLNMEITGGELKKKFGSQAYLRIAPQANSTFHGLFTADFSGEKPLTNLRALNRLATSVPESAPLIAILTGVSGVLAYRMRRYLSRRPARRQFHPTCRATSLWVS
jgi:hypothetical protein